MSRPKVAAVTGGSAGIGKAICEDLLAQGYEVVSLALERCAIDHASLHNIEVDLMDRAATAQAMRALAARSIRSTSMVCKLACSMAQRSSASDTTS